MSRGPGMASGTRPTVSGSTHPGVTRRPAAVKSRDSPGRPRSAGSRLDDVVRLPLPPHALLLEPCEVLAGLLQQLAVVEPTELGEQRLDALVPGAHAVQHGLL